MREFQPVKQYESEREAGISIVYVSIMAAIGVNMIVSGIALLIDRRLSCVFILLGIIITILSLSINDEVDKSNLAYCHIPVAKPNHTLGAKHVFPRSKAQVSSEQRP